MRMKVLLVDDEEQMRDLLRRMMEAMGYEPIVAEDGEEALRILHDEKVDVLVTDLVMPEMDGWMLAEQVRETHPDVPIMGVSGKVAPMIEESPFDRFVGKPFDFQALRKEIGELVEEESPHASQVPPVLGELTRLRERNAELEQEHIIAQKWREAERKGVSKLLRSIIDGIDHPVLVIGTDYRVGLMNRVVRDTYLGGNGTGRVYCYQVCHHRDTPCGEGMHPCPLKQVHESLRRVVVVHEHVDAEDERHWVEVTASPLLREDGTLMGIVESARDITGGVGAGEVLQRSATEPSSLSDGAGAIQRRRSHSNASSHTRRRKLGRHGTGTKVYFGMTFASALVATLSVFGVTEGPKRLRAVFKEVLREEVLGVIASEGMGELEEGEKQEGKRSRELSLTDLPELAGQVKKGLSEKQVEEVTEVVKKEFSDKEIERLKEQVTAGLSEKQVETLKDQVKTGFADGQIERLEEDVSNKISDMDMEKLKKLAEELGGADRERLKEQAKEQLSDAELEELRKEYGR